MRKALLVLVAAGAPAAHAQVSVTYSLRFTEVLAGTSTPVAAPDGQIEPGEGARVLLTVTIAPGIGSPITYLPPPGPGSGTLAGLGSIFFDLNQNNAQGGLWTQLQRAQGWAFGSAGTGFADGSMLAGQAGQFVLPGMTANATNPVDDIWRGTWTPSTYTTRMASFRCVAAVGTEGGDTSILINYGNDPGGNPQYAAQFHWGIPSVVHIPVIPAPSTAMLLTLPLAPIARRRRP